MKQGKTIPTDHIESFDLISRWWQLKYLLFSPRKLGKISQFDEYFSDGLKPPTSNWIISYYYITPELLKKICLMRIGLPRIIVRSSSRTEFLPSSFLQDLEVGRVNTSQPLEVYAEEEKDSLSVVGVEVSACKKLTQVFGCGLLESWYLTTWVAQHSHEKAKMI